MPYVFLNGDKGMWNRCDYLTFLKIKKLFFVTLSQNIKKFLNSRNENILYF